MQTNARAAAAVILGSIAFAAAAALAQPEAPKFVKATSSAPRSVHAGKSFPVSISITIDSPYHIQANPAKDGFIPTELEVGPLKGFKIGKVAYPKPVITTMSGEKVPVYEGKIQIKADVAVDKSVKPGRYTIPISLKYQGCDERACFPPTAYAMKAAVSVTGGASE